MQEQKILEAGVSRMSRRIIHFWLYECADGIIYKMGLGVSEVFASHCNSACSPWR
ncbi:ubiquitin c-terminal hydrolase, partial [Moniliophthora roreri]